MAEGGESKPYNFMTWEIDTTGRLLCDEIFYMSCLFNNLSYSAHIMPYRDISRFAAQKHQVVTSSHRFYRYLRRKPTGKIIKTKTEYVALQEFLFFLKQAASYPIVLMTYERNEFTPYILIQALKRYELLGEFKELVYGFGHSYGFVKKKCKKSMSSFNLRSLASVMLNKTDIKNFDSFNRAKLINEILLHLCNGDNSEQAEDLLVQEMQKYVKTVAEFENDLEIKTNKANLQLSLRPVFLPYLRSNISRKKMLTMRNNLIAKGLGFEALEDMWKKGRDMFKNELNDMFNDLDAVGREDMIAVLTLFFESIDSKDSSKNRTLSISEKTSKNKDILTKNGELPSTSSEEFPSKNGELHSKIDDVNKLLSHLSLEKNETNSIVPGNESSEIKEKKIEESEETPKQSEKVPENKENVPAEE